jgi:class 3 adenylate cyclase
VVAGIVGVRKFQYDVWGDTVNTASRMENCGEVGLVNISATTYALVKEDPTFSIGPCRLVEVKGKGTMEMYFVRLRSGQARDTAATAQEPAWQQ